MKDDIFISLNNTKPQEFLSEDNNRSIGIKNRLSELKSKLEKFK